MIQLKDEDSDVHVTFSCLNSTFQLNYMPDESYFLKLYFKQFTVCRARDLSRV
jgi:hypothetical protein